jgi:NUMOD4 motif-containing protein
MELWKPIRTFPEYSVSDHGRVVNRHGQPMVLMRNQRGVVHVGLMKGGIQFKRAIAPLVAQEFLPPPPNEAFDTPINLNGDRGDNHRENLLWRPRWFAIKYYKQFFNDARGFQSPIEEVETGEQFETSWDAAIRYGLIDVHIKLAILNQQRVWPTQQLYQRLCK